MSTTVEIATGCTCGSIGAPKVIRQCPTCFHYWLGDRRMQSAGSVIRTLLPTDYSMVPPEVLENALNRGKWVDRYFCQYLKAGDVTIPVGEPQEWCDRYLSPLIDWWEHSEFRGCNVDPQYIAFSEEDGIAGAMDLRLSRAALDLKCVSSLQPSYKLQLGCYVTYEQLEAAGIIHVTKNRVRYVPYNAAECSNKWWAGVQWFKALQELTQCK